MLRTMAAGLAFLFAGSASADTLEAVGEDGSLALGFRTDAAPFSFLGEDGPAGYSVRLCEAIADAVAAELGLNDLALEFHPVTAESRFDALTSGRIDILCGATTVTLGRREVMDFSLFTFVTGAALLSRQAAPVNDLAAADGRRLGVLAGTTTQAVLRDRLAAAGVSAEIRRFEARPAGLQALLDGEIDAYVGDRVLLMGMVLQLGTPGHLQLSDQYLTVEPYALAMRRGDDRLRLVADRTLAGLYRDGGIRPILAEAFPDVAMGDFVETLFLLQALND